MKIGIEVQRLFRKHKFGIEVSAIQLIKQLQVLNPNAEFVVYAKNGVDKKCLEANGNLKIKTIAGKLFVDFEQVFLPIAAKADKVDVLHCTGNTRPFFAGVPVVQTLHDVIFMDPISTKDSLYQQFGNYYRRKVVPLVTNKSDTVITVSHYEKQRILERIKVNEKKIKVVYNGIDEQRFRIIDSPFADYEIRKKYNLPSRFILFLGNTAARKNAARVIESYTIYASKNENPLPMVAPGLNANYISDTLSALKQLDKIKNFVTPGYIADEDLAGLYNAATLFLYPSLSEGFGMPLVEAMACGTPVITSSTSCLPEIAGRAGVLVDPTNTSAISEAVSRMLNNETYRLDKVGEGLDNAKRFSWKNTAEEVYEIYQQVHFKTQRIKHFAGKVAYEIQ
jgi:glycosyltransferase involved in cell wall biosynthesis